MQKSIAVTVQQYVEMVRLRGGNDSEIGKF